MFADDASKQSTDPNKPPNSISAKKLDGNFAICSPLENSSGNNRSYVVKQSKDGWILEPEFVFDVCENGQAVRYQLMGRRFGPEQV